MTRLSSLPAGKTVLTSTSPSGALTVTISNKEESALVEVNSMLSSSFNVDASKHHGKVIGDAWFGGTSWSSDERYFAYVSSPKKEKPRTLFDTATSDDSAKYSKKFEFEQDWGEKYVGVDQLQITILDTRSGDLFLVPHIGGHQDTAGQPVWIPNSYELCFTGWSSSPHRLGMIYCFQRPCSLFTYDATALLSRGADNGATVKFLTEELSLARSGRVDPSGERVVFLGRESALESHGGNFQLFSKSLADRSLPPEIIVDLVPRSDSNTDEFPGIFCSNLPLNCFLDASTVLFTSTWRSMNTIVKVDVRTKEVSKFPMSEIYEDSGSSDDWNRHTDRSATLMDICTKYMVVVTSTPNQPEELRLLELTPDFKIHRSWVSPPGTHSVSNNLLPGSLDTDRSQCGISGIRWKRIRLSGTDGIDFEGILSIPPTSDADTTLKKLIIVPHGGPHSCTPTTFIPSYAYLSLLLDAAILTVTIEAPSDSDRTPLIHC